MRSAKLVLKIYTGSDGFFKCSQEAIIYGNAPDYKGDEIVFYYYSDFITSTWKPK